jgi:hypothetical protein
MPNRGFVWATTGTLEPEKPGLAARGQLVTAGPDE